MYMRVSMYMVYIGKYICYNELTTSNCSAIH